MEHRHARLKGRFRREPLVVIQRKRRGNCRACWGSGLRRFAAEGRRTARPQGVEPRDQGGNVLVYPAGVCSRSGNRVH